MSEVIEREHIYQAEATALLGTLQLPLEAEIPAQAYVELPEDGGYRTQREREFRLESVLSYRSAYAQVAGNREVKPGHGWSTLATAVVEGLNMLDVVTADRVVAQISTEHPLIGYVPSVTFLGTRFENLRIGGHPVKLDMDLGIMGAKPENDAPYLKDAGFMGRVARQRECLGKGDVLPADVAERYNRSPLKFENGETVECSLVNQAEGSYPGRSFGHVIEVPHFGLIYLATLRVEQSDFQAGTGIPKRTTIRLTMIDLRMGCVATGEAGVGAAVVNGHGKP
jgi:hypothetical protein